MKGEGKKCRENWSESASVLMEIEVVGIVLVSVCIFVAILFPSAAR